MSSPFVTLTYQKNQLTAALSVKILVMLLGRSLERNAFHTLKKIILCVNHITLHFKQPDVSCVWPETKPLRAGCGLISPAEKELTTGSNCPEKKRHGIILKVQFTKIAGLTDKKACLNESG